MSNITQALARLFDRHRIVFWYDTKKELRAEYDALTLPDVEKIELKNNEYGIKHLILRQEPKQKFLLYYEGPPPPDLDNWLLDVLLAHGEFRADQVSLWLSELGLGPEFWEVVQDHHDFYRAPSRSNALKAKLDKDDTLVAIRMKMLAVCVNANTEPRLDVILEMLLAELAEGRDERIRLIKRAELDDFLWSRMERQFGYTSESPGVRDFVVELFKSSYAMGLEEPARFVTQAPLTTEALVFLKRWKDSRRYHQAFETLSEECADILDIERDLQNRDGLALVEMDYFRLIDQKILTDLVQRVVNRTITAAECDNLIWRRRTTHWFGEFIHIYKAIDHASHFMAELAQANLVIQSLADGVRKYTETWYRLDLCYRKFIYHYRASNQVPLLQPLFEQIENLYSNNFLLKVNDTWQQVVDASQTWDAAPITSQRAFYNSYVADFLKNQKKVVVVISDGMRFEIGTELVERVQREDRYTADLEPMLAMLPSYTQLGMAALLPNETISLKGKIAFVDGQSTMGTENRRKVLARAVSGGATAVRAKDFLGMTREESRALFRDNQVIYLYHNQIDAVGDKRESEERVFDAVEETLKEMVTLIKKLANANVTNMLVTADHGFIYQHHPLDESEFASIEVSGDDIHHRDRRFVVGKGLQPSSSARKFSPGEVGLEGDYEILIPKSINRLRLQGAGSRYVHGGAALQEVVVPVIRINKKRSSDIGKVEVDILRSPSSTISTGQLSVALYQDQPVSAKRQARKLRAGIYTQSGELISDQHDLIFDFGSENAREREVPVRFVLSREADQANEQEVFLKLEELVPDTTHYREYRSVRYTLRRSFTSDFDL